MPRLAPKELKLEAKEREHLEKLINRHKKRMGVWKLSVFRPKRKNDSGEFIPLAL